jgi:uncharacterized pyridoxamine 5'-phosphate oxidase family protein
MGVFEVAQYDLNINFSKNKKTKWLIQNGEPYFLKVNRTSPNPVFGVFKVAEHEISIYLSRNKIADPKWRTFLSKS